MLDTQHHMRWCRERIATARDGLQILRSGHRVLLDGCDVTEFAVQRIEATLELSAIVATCEAMHVDRT